MHFWLPEKIENTDSVLIEQQKLVHCWLLFVVLDFEENNCKIIHSTNMNDGKENSGMQYALVWHEVVRE
jgi:hypothetical protein